MDVLEVRNVLSDVLMGYAEIGALPVHGINQRLVRRESKLKTSGDHPFESCSSGTTYTPFLMSEGNTTTPVPLQSSRFDCPYRQFIIVNSVAFHLDWVFQTVLQSPTHPPCRS